MKQPFNSQIIKPWDWHYRVGFDPHLRDEIAQKGQSLTGLPEKAIFDETLAFFSSLISMGQLVTLICDKDVAVAPSNLDLAAEKLLHIPDFLGATYISKINSAPSLDPTTRGRLIESIQLGMEMKFRNILDDLFRIPFGDQLTDLLDGIDLDEPERFVDEPIERDNFHVVVNEIVEDLLENPPGIIRALKKHLPKFRTSILESSGGFAEYWPKALSNSGNNELLVYNNNDQLGRENLKATIAHEIFGHGIFYAIAESNPPPLFDHGAMCLIEGWATWVEWISVSDLLAKNLKYSSQLALRNFSLEDPGQIQENIRSNTKKSGYSADISDTGIEYFFQYPGYTQSYVLGGLWFERRLENEDPQDFFSKLHSHPWGDFFRLW